MKPTRLQAALLALFLCLLSGLSSSRANPGANNRASKKLIRNTLATWKALEGKIEINELVNETAPDGLRTIGGTVTAFGNRAGLRVSFVKKSSDDEDEESTEIRRISIDFPASAKLSSRHLRALLGPHTPTLFTRGAGASIGIKHLEVDILDKRIDGGKLTLSFGSWAPMGGNPRDKGSSVTISDIVATYTIRELQRAPRFEGAISAYLLLPGNLARTMGVGETSLQLVGSTRTAPFALRLGAAIASDEIPLHPNRSVVMKKARVEFQYEGGKPALALLGTIELRPAGHNPIRLKGQVSIAATGQIYAEGWMDQNDSIDLGKGVFLEKAGLGFGANFSTGVPTPIVAIEGGLKVVDHTGRVRGQGAVTIGLDTGNPTRTVIDAELSSIAFEDFLTVFGKKSIPRELASTISKMHLHKVHLTQVPPGGGATLFGVAYEPGLLAEADISYGDFRGHILVDVDDSGIEAFGSMSPLQGRGFSLTGTRRGKGPSIYLSLQPEKRVFLLALNGTLQVLGNTALADIYLSDAGFSATVQATLLGGFDTRLDIAGTALGKNASLYAQAVLNDRDGLVQKLSSMAADEIDRTARSTSADYERKKQALERLRPQLHRKAQELARKQGEVRKDYERLCKLLDRRKQQEAQQRRKEEEMRNLRAEIARLDRELSNDKHRRATPLRKTSCPAGLDRGKFGDYCWVCPRGYKRIPAPKAPWSYRQACTKLMPFPQPPTFSKAKKGTYVGCNKPLINNRGQCWECPRGYVRKLSVHGIHTDKACTLQDSESRSLALNAKRVLLGKKEAELQIFNKGVAKLAAELGHVGSNVCQVAKSTELINADPRVNKTFREWSALSLSVNEGQKFLDHLQKTSVGTLEAAAWITRNGGRAAGIVRIQEARFEGCLSSLNGGNVAMKIRGKVAGRPFSGAFDLNLRSPAASVAAMARTLTKGAPLRASLSNGSCRRPQVPRPQLGGTQVGARLATLERSTKAPKRRPQGRRAPKPSWAN